jgi:hypothetical protein
MKQIIVILMLAATAGYSQSQVTFNRTYDREELINSNEGALIENSLGYLTGNFIWRPNYFLKLWLMQIDFNGDTLWNKVYGDSINGDAFAPRSLKVSNDSSYYYVGAGTGNYSLVDTIFTFGSLIKITNSGDTLCTSKKKFAPKATTVWDMIKSSKEELVFVGNNYDFHPIWQYVNIGACAYAFDTSGNLLWNQTYTHGTGNQFLWQLVETPDKGFIMCGYSYFGPTGNNADFWVIRTDSVGNVIWENFYGGAGDQGGTGITKLSDGNYLLSGGRVAQNYAKARLIKIDINGAVIWQRTYNTSLGNLNEWIYRTLELPNGDIITVGISENNPSGYEGGWIMKTGPQGWKKWERYFYYLGGDSYIDNFNTGILTSDGGILLAGFASPGAGVFNPPFISPSDVWLVKLDSLGCDSAGCPTVFTGIEPNPYVSVTNILAYPNPFSSQSVILNVPGVKPNEGVGFQITDVLGKTLRTGTLKATAMDYVIISEQETQHLSQGIYFIQLKTKNGVFGAKVVKE